MSADLQGRSAVVTGASRGIGFAVAKALAAAGANVTITGRDAAQLAVARRELDGAGPGGVEAIEADIRDYDRVNAAITTSVARFGNLDILVNNAGVGIFSRVAETTPAQWATVIDTNLTGVFYACHAALPFLRARGGYIINISSLAGTNPFVGGGAYCASKAGLNAFTEVLMQEIRHDDIRVTTIAPGSVDTGFAGNTGKGADWKIAPADVAELVLDLLTSHPRSLASRIELRPSKPRK